MPDNSQNSPPRRTIRNMLRFALSGNFIEIARIARRRSLNLVKFTKRVYRRVFRFYLNNPRVVWHRDNRRLKRVLAKFYGIELDRIAPAKIKVALVLQDGLTYPKSSAFIRLISPLTDPSLNDKLSIKLFPGNTPDIGPGFDVCIVQRTAVAKLDAAKNLASNLKRTGTQLVLDSDDAFHAIDPTHPEHAAHTERLEAFNYLATNSNQVWLSTARLVRDLKELNKRARVISNSLDPRLWRSSGPTRRKLNGPISMVYMGTVSHDEDFKLIFPVLKDLADKYPGGFKLTIIGVAGEVPDYPWLERIYQPAGYSIYPRFVDWFLEQGPFDIGLSPLVENDFNLNKSDIKCLDYLAAGIVPLVSDIEPYQTAKLAPLVIKLTNDEAVWRQKLEQIILEPETFRKDKEAILAKAEDYLWTERSSTQTATELYGLLGGK